MQGKLKVARVSVVVVVVVAGLTACVSTGPAAPPPSPESPSPTPVVSVERPEPVITASCDELVPQAAELGFVNPVHSGVIDLEAATLVQAGVVTCEWSATGSDAGALKIVLVPSALVPADPVAAGYGCADSTAGLSCNDELGTEAVHGMLYASLATGPAARDAFTSLLASTQTALESIEVVEAAPPQRTLAADALAAFDFATVAPWFELTADEHIAASGAQYEIGAEAERLASTEAAAWGSYSGAPWVQVDILPGGAWAAPEFLAAVASPSQVPTSFVSVEVDGLAEAVQQTTQSTVCGAMGTDLVCISAYGVDADRFLSGVSELVTHLH